MASHRRHNSKKVLATDHEGISFQVLAEWLYVNDCERTRVHPSVLTGETADGAKEKSCRASFKLSSVLPT
eukprot:452629-Pleurochrysis_carterae.AAC.1